MTFIVRNEQKIFYETHGSGEALLLLQGNSASSAHFKLTGDIAYFQQLGQVISFDYRGTGQSDRQSPWPLDWYRQCADDAYYLLTTLKVKRCHVIGSSGGAIIAFWLAALYPQIVSSLIADSFSLNFKGNMAAVIRETRRNISLDQEKFWSEGHGDDWRDVIAADTDFLERFAAAQNGTQIDLPLKKVRCPVLLCGSKEDDLVPDITEQLMLTAQQLQDAIVYMHPKGRHPFMWSMADEFREQSLKFINH